jgi:hypothetical protein
MGWDWPDKEYKDEPDKLERHRTERAENGFSVFDWWSFDTYIAGVIANAVIKFRDEGVGYPANMDPEEWKNLCTEIAEPLLAWSDDKFDLDFKEGEALYDRVKEAMHKFADNFGSFWD